MNRRQTVLSRHRLPAKYRFSLMVFWLTPILMLLLAIVAGKGLTSALLDLRLIAALAVMTLPALYIWQEGVDVLPDGIRTRVHIPRTYTYEHLERWQYDSGADQRVITVWDRDDRKVLECRAGHLSQFPLLVRSLSANLRS